MQPDPSVENVQIVPSAGKCALAMGFGLAPDWLRKAHVSSDWLKLVAFPILSDYRAH